MRKTNNLKPEERFTRTLFGLIMIIAAFVSWGKWVVMVLGVLFLISAREGYCVTCEIYKKIHKSKGANRCR
jgi:hypothetical protein